MSLSRRTFLGLLLLDVGRPGYDGPLHQPGFPSGPVNFGDLVGLFMRQLISTTSGGSDPEAYYLASFPAWFDGHTLGKSADARPVVIVLAGYKYRRYSPGSPRYVRLHARGERYKLSAASICVPTYFGIMDVDNGDCLRISIVPEALQKRQEVAGLEVDSHPHLVLEPRGSVDDGGPRCNGGVLDFESFQPWPAYADDYWNGRAPSDMLAQYGDKARNDVYEQLYRIRSGMDLVAEAVCGDYLAWLTAIEPGIPPIKCPREFAPHPAWMWEIETEEAREVWRDDEEGKPVLQSRTPIQR